MIPDATPPVRRWYPVALVSLAASASLAAFHALPPFMVVHWDLGGIPNGWLPRAVGAAILPVLLAFVASTLPVRRLREHGTPASRERIVPGVLALLFVTHLMVLAVNLGVRVPMDRAAMIIVGGMFIVVGRALPLAPASAAMGVRTPWTLSSDRVWHRTHLLAGQAMAVCGAVMIASAVLLPVAVAMPVMVAAMVASVVAPSAYSWLTWKRESRK